MKISLLDGEFIVLSDLHIGHQASRLQGVAPLAPLMACGRTLIFNGDTFEMRSTSDRLHSAAWVSELQALLENSGTRGIFISGNHDPIISETNHLECAETGTLITHGDVLFDNVAPWSTNASRYASAHQRELAGLKPEEKSDLATRLAALRRATCSYDISHVPARPGLVGAMVHFLETIWPPWRPLRILQSWAEIPSRAWEFSQTWRPGTRTLIIGHSHLGGVWHRNALTVINTGTSMVGFRPRAVRIAQGVITLHRLILKNGGFDLGAPIKTLPFTNNQGIAEVTKNASPHVVTK